jgi:hypothetical protein
LAVAATVTADSATILCSDVAAFVATLRAAAARTSQAPAAQATPGQGPGSSARDAHRRFDYSRDSMAAASRSRST